VAGDEHGQHVVAQLLVAHLLAGVFILRQHQHGAQVARVDVGAAALGDDRVDDPVHVGDGGASGPAARVIIAFSIKCPQSVTTVTDWGQFTSCVKRG
jgi:hypothetical protein